MGGISRSFFDFLHSF